MIDIKTDIVVVGGGHAGIEAAHAAARLGCDVVLVTIHVDLIGQMSCNPAIGGIAKGNIVREIDALGGAMGRISDKAGIQFRMLNKSKGLAVWGPRAQADKSMYRIEARRCLEELPKLRIYQGCVTEILADDFGILGIKTDTGTRIGARCIVLTMGTFLNGLGHIGSSSFKCGRIGEPPSLHLSESIQKLGVKYGRLKTGTPARIDGRSVDYSKMTKQEGDKDPWAFSFMTTGGLQNKAVCWTLKTNQATHDIIRDNLEKSALYGGRIKSVGPRYCPSIEDKVVRFGDRDGHTLFLEPEGLDNHEMYLNGFSTSLPLDVQVQMVRSLSGLEKAEIIRPAYAIEYDYFYPVQLHRTLESRIVEGLFFAGQINGTSGYEEAGCQGLVAGINAVARVRGEEPLVLARDSSYTGVLIDDLVTKGTEEPYRMFTSRAEYRLLLRQDNADERLMPLAFERGLLPRVVFDLRRGVWDQRRELKDKLKSTKLSIPQLEKLSAGASPKVQRASDFLKRPEARIDQVLKVMRHPVPEREILLGVEADIKYEGFVRKQREEIERHRRMETTEIPSSFDYDQVEGLLTESRDKLKKILPTTLGQASRISGVTPADISVLIMYLSRNE